MDMDLELQPEAESLPIFSELTNDEDRELKALTRLPGTYHLVCNPNTFTAVEDDSDRQELLSPTGSAKVKRESVSSNNSSLAPERERLRLNLTLASSEESAADPDVVILRQLEEPGP